MSGDRIHLRYLCMYVCTLYVVHKTDNKALFWEIEFVVRCEKRAEKRVKKMWKENSKICEKRAEKRGEKYVKRVLVYKYFPTINNMK